MYKIEHSSLLNDYQHKPHFCSQIEVRQLFFYQASPNSLIQDFGLESRIEGRGFLKEPVEFIICFILTRLKEKKEIF